MGGFLLGYSLSFDKVIEYAIGPFSGLVILIVGIFITTRYFIKRQEKNEQALQKIQDELVNRIEEEIRNLKIEITHWKEEAAKWEKEAAKWRELYIEIKNK